MCTFVQPEGTFCKSEDQAVVMWNSQGLIKWPTAEVNWIFFFGSDLPNLRIKYFKVWRCKHFLFFFSISF